MKRENVGSWNSHLKKESVWHSYSAQLQTPWKSTRNYFGIYKKYWTEEVPEGSHQEATSLRGATYPLVAARWLVGPMLPLWLPSFSIRRVLFQKKIKEEAFGRNRRRHEAVLEQNQSRALAGPSYRGNFPPGGGNHRHRHHQHSSHWRGLFTINIFISTISSPNPSSSLVTNLRLATPIGTCKVASSVNYSL